MEIPFLKEYLRFFIIYNALYLFCTAYIKYWKIKVCITSGGREVQEDEAARSIL
jgi:hypothetical protein